MKLLIDNTFLHRVFECTRSDGPLHVPDLLALFHFAEHVMFSERIEVSGFEPDSIFQTSMEASDYLFSLGCTRIGSDHRLLDVIHLSPAEYATACDHAAPEIAATVSAIPATTLAELGSSANEYTHPIGAVKQPIRKWLLARCPGPDARRRIAINALDDKALGSYDYMIGKDAGLYNQLRALVPNAKGNKPAIAASLNVFFRTAVNQNLAATRGAHYCPAPQRVNVINQGDFLVRHKLSAALQQVVLSDDGKACASSIIDCLRQDQVLPLPMFALHFLRRKRLCHPVDMLEAARVMRDHSDVVLLRRYLEELEAAHLSGDIDAIRTQSAKFAEVAEELRMDLRSSSDKWFSKVSLALEPILKRLSLRWPWIDLRLSEVPADLRQIRYLLTPLRRRRLLLRRIAAELIFDKTIGVDIHRMTGRRGIALS